MLTTAHPRRPRIRDAWPLGLAALWLLGVGYGLRDPWPADEPRFALIGRDIVETGRWWIPYRGPELYAEKPPLYPWLQALSYAGFGQTRLAFLLPSLLAAFITLFAVVDVAWRMHGRKVACWTGFALLFSLQFVVQARSAQIDMVLVMFTTLGLYGLLRHLVLGPDWRWYSLAGLAMGLGVLTKGTGFLPWLLLLPWLLARRRGMRGIAMFSGGWRWWLGPLAFAAPLLAWALPLLFAAAQPGNSELAAYRDDLLLRQTVTRFADSWHHHQPVWYFVVEVVPLFWLPLTLLLPWAVPAWRRRIGRGDARPLLLLGWVVLVLLFFSLSPGKRGVYILPALPAFALALGPLLPGLCRKIGVQRGLRALALLIALSLASGAAFALYGEPAYATRLQAQYGVAPWDWLLVTALVAVLSAFLLRRRGERAFAATMLVLWTGIGLAGYRDLDAARSGAAFMAQVDAHLDGNGELGLVGTPEQFLLQSRSPARSFGYRTALSRQQAAGLDWLAASPGRWLLLPNETTTTRCLDTRRIIDLGIANRRRWALAPHEALDPHCPLHRSSAS